MPAGIKKGRNRLSLMLSLGKAGDPHASNVRTSSQHTSSVMSTTTLDSMSTSTTHLPAHSPHKTSAPGSPLHSSPSSPAAMPRPPLPLPATTNEFDAQEKTRLLKQARKLSQIFGEMLTMSEADEAQAQSAGARRSRDEARAGRLPARSASVASSGNKLQRPPNRVRSRPTLRGAPASPPMPFQANILVTPPASAAQLTGTTLAPSTSQLTPKSAGTPALPSAKEPLQNKFPSMPPPRAKQSTVLPVHPDSPSATQVLTQGNSARLARSNSKRSRGRSMDCVRSEVPAVVSPVAAAQASRSTSTKRPATASGNEATLRRSKSMWERKEKGRPGTGGGAPRQDAKPELDRAAVIRDLKENSKFGELPKMTRTQRSQSVRRARKLNNVFGSEPPQALYQFSAFVDKRISEASIYSVSSSGDLLSVQNSSRAAKHRSISSVASTISEPASPVAPMHDMTPAKGHRRTPSTPAAPFSDAVDEFDDETEQSHPELFRQRRLRAQKLSRFFGVDPHDISPSLPAVPPLPHSRSAERDAALPYFGRAGPAPRKGAAAQPPASGVDVHIQKPSGKFWSRNQQPREVDMANVINRLREMR